MKWLTSTVNMFLEKKSCRLHVPFMFSLLKLPINTNPTRSLTAISFENHKSGVDDYLAEQNVL